MVTYTLWEARSGAIVAQGDNFALQAVETTRSLTTFDKVTGWIRNPATLDGGGLYHPLTKTLTVNDGDTIVFHGFLAETALTKDGVRYVFHSWRDYPAHVVHGRDARWVGVDVAHIIRDLWVEALSYDDAPDGVSVTAARTPWTAGTDTQPITASWHQGTTIGQLISQLAAAGIYQTEHYSYDADGNPSTVVRVGRREPVDHAATFDETNTVTQFSVELKPEHCPSALLVLGAGQGAARLAADVVSVNRPDRIRTGRVINASTGLDRAGLERLGVDAMRRSENPLPVQSFEVVTDSAQAPADTYRPGSMVTLKAHGLQWRAEVVATTTSQSKPGTTIVEVRQP